MRFSYIIAGLFVVVSFGAGCSAAPSASPASSSTGSVEVVTTTSPHVAPSHSNTTSTHSISDWLVNYQTYGANYEKTINFDAYDEAITATLAIPHSDSVWGIALYAEKGWQDGLPHRFYLQVAQSELGGIGGAYGYKHFGPYTDTITALVREASHLKKGENLSAHIQLYSEVYAATSSLQ